MPPVPLSFPSLNLNIGDIYTGPAQQQKDNRKSDAKAAGISLTNTSMSPDIVLGAVGSYLPSSVSRMAEGARDFAFVCPV